MINDIRNYFNRLIKNTKNDNIKFFSNIELGREFDNPHLHIQVWHDNQKQIDKIYNKVIDRFGLFSEYCKLTEQTSNKEIYEYVIKDYSKSMSDDELYRLDDVKRVFRGMLDKKVRFSSHSKSKYTKIVYKSLYSKHGIKKDLVDVLLDNSIIDVDGNVNNRIIEFITFVLFTTFKINRNKIIECDKCEVNNFDYMALFEWWIYGKLWNLMLINQIQNNKKDDYVKFYRYKVQKI